MLKPLLCLFLLATAGCGVAHQTIDLTNKLQFAERQPDTQIFFFAAPQTAQNLSSGWSEPERTGHGKLRWISSETASFSWNPRTEVPSFLHMRLYSESPAPLEIYSNDKLLWSEVVQPGKMLYSVQLPPGISETTFKKSPEGRIGIYSVVITPSAEIGSTLKPHEYPIATQLPVRNKSYPAWLSETGGYITFYEELSPTDTLEFGFSFDSRDSNAFANFQIEITPDQQTAKVAFEKRVDQNGAQFFQIPLARFLQAPGVKACKIQFRIQRDTAFGPAKVAWLQPRIIRNQIEEKNETPEQTERIRKAIRNANVLVILLDAASAKHFGCYGYPRTTTAGMDRLATEGLLFQKAYTNAVYTLASTATLFTGRLPSHHGILLHRNKLAPAALTLAEMLQHGGYSTAAFLANGNASEIFGLMQGFQTVEDVFRKKDYVGWGEDLTNSFLKWLPNNQSKQFFAYLHYREPHEPFNPPEPWIRKFADPQYSGNVGLTFESRTAIDTNRADLSIGDQRRILDLYDANLAYADAQVDRILSALRTAGIYDRTIVIVTADHGEAFWEHGYQGHNRQLYEESARIPFIIKLPSAAGLSGKKIEAVYETVDLCPSLLDLLDFPTPRVPLDGRSFLPSLSGNFASMRTVTIRSTQSAVSAILKDEYKLILTQHGKELFDLKKDRDEKRNLIDLRPVLGGYLTQQLREWIPLVDKKIQEKDEPVLDQETRENLKALGYLQ